MKAKIYLETHGCQMNVADSTRATKRLSSEGFQFVQSYDDADIVILNTCSIRARAESKVFNRLGQINHNTIGKAKIYGVMGCVAQLEGEELFRRSTMLDFVCGTGAIDRLPSLVSRILSGERKVLDTGQRLSNENWDLQPADHDTNHTAFVPIIEGCNKFCSYCIVPFSRGREISRPAVEIIKEVTNLRDSGFKEVQLIGQNVNSYRPKTNEGLEEFAGATPFIRLLKAVAATGTNRIKFTTSFPRDFHAGIVEAMNEYQNLCNWVHLPVQSGSDVILKAMRRGYKSADYLDKVAAIHNSHRNVALTTDIIVGFPGENEDDFTSTLDLLKQCNFHGAYIFKYSERPGTRAANMDDDVADEVKTERFQQVENLQREVQIKIYGSYIGTKQMVLVKGISARSEADVFGHSTCNKVINFKGGTDLVGRVVEVKVVAAKHNSLYGELAH